MTAPQSADAHPAVARALEVLAGGTAVPLAERASILESVHQQLADALDEQDSDTDGSLNAQVAGPRPTGGT